MIKSADVNAGLFHSITKRGGAQILKKEKKKMQGCWAVVKQRGMSGQSIGSVLRACRIWRTCLGN